MRYIGVFITFFVASGCARLSGVATIYPHSEVDLPTFCFHRENFRSQQPKRSQDSNPIPIRRFIVYEYAKINDEKIQWKTFNELPPADAKTWVKWIKQRPTRGPRKVVWYVLYLPDPILQPLSAFSCITYRTLPTGYRERAPALPLVPERLYYASLESMSGDKNGVFFIIRADASGKPIKLEYRAEDQIHVISGE